MKRVAKRRDRRIFARTSGKTHSKNVFGFKEPRGANKL